MPDRNHICITCGTQFDESGAPPVACPICEDERQYVRANGQEWTTLAAMRGHYRNAITELERGLFGIKTEPAYAIGQRAYIVKTASGNLLWDCVSFIDDETIAAITELGGLSAIAISHPHFHSSMVDWSRAFGGVPISIHADNEPWVMQPNPTIRFWAGGTVNALADLTIVRCGGHFPGSAVLHWPAGAEGRGALMTGDTIAPVADTRWVTFMYSYPNRIPLNRSAVDQIATAVAPFAFDRIYGIEPDLVVSADAKNAVRRSAERYIRHISG